MALNNKPINYKVTDSINHYNFGIDHDNILGRLEILNFTFQNSRNLDTN